MNFYAQNLTSEADFNIFFEALKNGFTSEEQHNRLLRIWKKISLLEHLKNSPTKSDVTVFKEMCMLLSTTQRQLLKSYHADHFLRDQIFITTDVPELESSLREKTAKKSHKETQRIAHIPLNEPNSSSSRSKPDGCAIYGLRTKFHGCARRKVTRGRRKPKNETERHRCIICNKDYFASNHHT